MALTAEYSLGCGLFEFDISTPLFEQMRLDFERLSPVTLNEAQLASVHENPGVYSLHYAGKLVYIGKADGDARTRLRKHRKQLLGRVGISPEDVTFRCLHFSFTWDPFKPESHMIKHYSPIWNSKGFGPNDPGRQRDTTKLADTHWHVRFPLNPEYPCSGVPSGQYDVLELLREVCRQSPFWIRFQGNREPRAGDDQFAYEAAQRDFGTATAVFVPEDHMTVKALLLLAIQALPNPDQWQLSQLPSHLLLYRETAKDYPRMTRLWPH